MPVLDAHAFSIRRGGVTAVDNIDLRLTSGSITALLGPNGSGKTSTMLGLLGLLPSGGRLQIFGTERPGPAERARIGFVPQDGGIPSGAFAMEWIDLQAALRKADADRVRQLVAELAIPQHRRPVRRLSGGERRRVALCAALVGEPDLLILDEPTAGMDPEMRAVAISVIRQAADRGAAILLSTHLLDEIVECADAIVVMRGGHVVRVGTREDLLGTAPLTWSPTDQAAALRSLFDSGHA